MERRFSLAHFLGRAAFALAAATTASTSFSQPADWPKGPIVFVAPFSPGGGGDSLTRLFGNELNKVTGTPFIVENRPGAGGNIGTAAVARAAADGNTVVFGTMGTMGTNHALYKNPGFSIGDFEPVALFGSTPLALVVSKDSPFRKPADIIAHARQHPGELSCASGGNGTVSHLACALLQQMTGIELSHVPYRSSSAAYVDIRAGRVSFMIDVTPPLMPQIKDGNLRALAVSMKQPVPALPDAPPLADTVPGYEIFSWDGMFAPKGTPAARLDRLHDIVATAVGNPEFRQAMSERGYMLAAMPRKEFADFVKKESVRMVELVRKMGVTLD
ncbi:Tripartite tricarboxylate transporter family receptor [Pigmentiphaga humi]|uniref:Tripartite tricarboxylate transporter family receptor n=1 Tax=Pigmentiphaga humi TaxID=2478468 RepID=A0A3P4AWS7_9BURK|nr:tripartite tricarboxylate transporter substrate binding protein [Pigmentiphaga humi]VCU68172.1 Tripartite tricarboxylate transporter family receptor [Pigmentiphaga humi]